MDIDKLDRDFLYEYHKTPLSEMVMGLDRFLNGEALLPFHNNRHWVYLSSQIERLEHDRVTLSAMLFPTELPGMVYGMFCNAWSQLLEDIKKEEAAKRYSK